MSRRGTRRGWWCNLRCLFAVLVSCGGGILVLAACFGLPVDSLDWTGVAAHAPSPTTHEPNHTTSGDALQRLWQKRHSATAMPRIILPSVEPATAAAAVPVAIPNFAFSAYIQSLETPLCKPHFDVWRNKFLEMFWKTLENHSARTDEGSATLSLMCCFRGYQYIYDRDCNESDVVDRARSRFTSLPLRSPESPYLVLVWGLEADNKRRDAWAHEIIKQRDDFLYMHFDLRGHYKFDDVAPTLPGITIAPPLFWKGPKANFSRPPKYFLTFRGSLRKHLAQGKMHPRVVISEIIPNITRTDVVIEWMKPLPDALMGGLQRLKDNETQRYQELMDTSYALMLRGVDRWTYRLSEAVGACAIPVFLADGRGGYGHTMPYEELINWREVSVHLGEILGLQREKDVLKHLQQDPRALVDNLPGDPGTILAMRRRLCEINEQYFATPEKRAEAALRSAAAFLATRKGAAMHCCINRGLLRT